MILAVLADIHGNLPALEAVLADLDQVTPGLVIVNGDLVNRGPSNPEVIERLWERPWRFTRGNHDDLVLRWAKGDPEIHQLLPRDPAFLVSRWTAEQLSPPHLEFLASLEPEVFLESWGLRIAHGSPRHFREGLGERTPPEERHRILQDYPSRALVGSHTHVPYQGWWESTLVLNTGAVGTPFDRDPRAHYLLLDPDSLRFELRRVPYDQEEALRAFRRSGLLDAGGLAAHIFYEELRLARPLLLPFYRWLKAQGAEPEPATWAAFQEQV